MQLTSLRVDIELMRRQVWPALHRHEDAAELIRIAITLDATEEQVVVQQPKVPTRLVDNRNKAGLRHEVRTTILVPDAHDDVLVVSDFPADVPGGIASSVGTATGLRFSLGDFNPLVLERQR